MNSRLETHHGKITRIEKLETNECMDENPIKKNVKCIRKYKEKCKIVSRIV